MREQYNFLKPVKKTYSKKLKKQITIRLDEDVIDYFKHLSEESGISYQNLINLYLKDCTAKHKELRLEWAAKS